MAFAGTIQERNARLDKLKADAKTWISIKKQKLDQETQFLRQVLQARGANNAAALNLQEGVKNLEDEIAAYLFVE